jgi:hypothetical protein
MLKAPAQAAVDALSPAGSPLLASLSGKTALRILVGRPIHGVVAALLYGCGAGADPYIFILIPE